MNAHTNIVNPPIRVKYPLIVKTPVSGSLTGNCFHGNNSAKLIRFSKLWKLNLRHRKIKFILNNCDNSTRAPEEEFATTDLQIF